MSRFWSKGIAVVALAAAVGLWGLPVSLAKPPGGGGGGGNPGPSYTIVALNNEWDGQVWETGCEDLNDSRACVGNITGSDPSTGARITLAAYWAADNTLTPLRGNATHAKSINNAGEIVGIGTDSGGNFVGLYWPNADAEPIPLPRVDGDDYSLPVKINDQGIICGGSTVLDENGVREYQHAVLWHVTNGQIAGPVSLPSGGFDVIVPQSLNNVDAGGMFQVVGHSVSPPVAVTWDVLVLADGTLLPFGMSVLDVPSYAMGISDNYLICGDVQGVYYPGSWAAVVWTGNVPQPLRLLPDATQSEALDINATGAVAGTLWFPDSSRGKNRGLYAVVWPDPNSAPILLNSFLAKGSPLIRLNYAAAINAGGAIVGSANGGAFLAIPK